MKCFFHCYSGEKIVSSNLGNMVNWLTLNKKDNCRLSSVDDNKPIFFSDLAVMNLCSELSSVCEGLSSCVALFKGARELTCHRGTCKRTSTTVI